MKINADTMILEYLLQTTVVQLSIFLKCLQARAEHPRGAQSLMETRQKRVVQVLDECFEKGKS